MRPGGTTSSRTYRRMRCPIRWFHLGPSTIRRASTEQDFLATTLDVCVMHIYLRSSSIIHVYIAWYCIASLFVLKSRTTMFSRISGNDTMRGSITVQDGSHHVQHSSDHIYCWGRIFKESTCFSKLPSLLCADYSRLDMKANCGAVFVPSVRSRNSITNALL